MCSDVLSYQLLGVWQAWSHGPFSFLRRFNLRKQLRKSQTKFLFPQLSFWTTHRLNLYTLLGLFQIASKPGGQRHELKEHSQSWSFSPSHQMTSQICKGHCMSFPDYAMCAGHAECLWLNWINCWNVPPTFMKGTSTETRGTAVLCLDQSIIVWGYLFRMQVPGHNVESKFVRVHLRSVYF